MLNELESQNDQQVEGIMGKVKLLKDVSVFFFCFFFFFFFFFPPPCAGPRESDREEAEAKKGGVAKTKPLLWCNR